MVTIVLCSIFLLVLLLIKLYKSKKIEGAKGDCLQYKHSDLPLIKPYKTSYNNENDAYNFLHARKAYFPLYKIKILWIKLYIIKSNLQYKR